MTDNVSNISGGINMNANTAHIGGDAVGRDKVTDVRGDQVMGNKIVQEAPVPVVIALHQLPSPPGDFVGRTVELDAILSDAYAQHGAVITGIRGLGGIGKTALALVIAERVKAQYPDGQFYLNLRGASDQPMSPAEALATVIRAYYPTAKLPEALAELQGLYHSVLDGQRALILLDDARDAAQIKSLLPPASCLLLITSRQHFTLPGLHATDLEALSPEDARKLLLEIAPRLEDVTLSEAKGLGRQGEIPRRFAARNDTTGDIVIASEAKQSPILDEIASTPPSAPAARSAASTRDASRNDVASEIARLCGYLPQALRAAGSLLAVAIDLDPAEYVAELRDERTRLERLGIDPALGVSVEASLNLSYALLSPEAQRVFGQLSVFPASFDAAAEEAICADEGHRHLSALLQLSLAQYNDATKRYSLHDLVRLFASAPPSPREGEGRGEGERAAAQRRHAEHYSQVFGNANQMLLEGGSIMTSGLALFDTEWPNIQQGQKWSQEHTNQDQAAAEACNWYGGQGSLLNLRFHPRVQIQWMMAALDAARVLKNRKAEGVHLGNLGLAYADLGETRKAIEFYEQRLVIAREIGDRRGEGNALGNLGIAYKNLGETRKAIELYEQRLVIAREIGDRRGEGADLGNLGLAYAALGETRKAIEFYQQQLKITREIGDRRGEGNALGNLGIAYKDLGETRQAIEFYEQHLVIAREIGDRRGEGNALGNLGNAYYTLGETHKAIEFHEQALAVMRDIGDKRAEGSILGNLGNAYSELEERQRAIEFYNLALSIAREIGDKRGEGSHLWNMADEYDKLGEREHAIVYAEASLKIREQIEDPRAEKVRRQLAEWKGSGQ